MPTHHSPQHRGTNAAVSSRRKSCSKHLLVLAQASYVDLDEVREAAAITALADLLAPYLDPDEEEAA